jgi:hypothetical protein
MCFMFFKLLLQRIHHFCFASHVQHQTKAPWKARGAVVSTLHFTVNSEFTIKAPCKAFLFGAWMPHEPLDMCTSECMHRSTSKTHIKMGSKQWSSSPTARLRYGKCMFLVSIKANSARERTSPLRTAASHKVYVKSSIALLLGLD